LLLTMI